MEKEKQEVPIEEKIKGAIFFFCFLSVILFIVSAMIGKDVLETLIKQIGG